MPKTSPRPPSSFRCLLMSLLLMTPMAISAQSAIPTLTPSQLAISKAYSIDPALKYPGYSVVQGIEKILQSAEAEAREGAKDAWDLGYKTGVSEWKPRYDGANAEIKYWKDLLEKSKIEASTTWEALQRQKVLTLYALGGIYAGSLLSFAAGVLLF